MEEFEYEIIAGEVKITAWMGEGEILSIPKQIEGLPVTVIGGELFEEYGVWVEELILPETVRKIEHPAALGHTRLSIDDANCFFHTDGYALYEEAPEGKTLAVVYLEDERESYTVENGTVQIGEDAFSGQEFIKEVILPDTVKYIKEAAFFLCGRLQRIHLSEHLVEIGAEAFSRSPYLESLHLPASLQVLSEQALTNTYDWDRKKTGLRKITVSQENPYFYADDSGLYERLKSGGIKLIKYLGGEKTVTLPKEVSIIGASAFRRSGIVCLTIPSAVREIHEDAFLECSLANVRLEADDITLYIPQKPLTLWEEVMRGFRGAKDGRLYQYERYGGVMQGLKFCLEKVKMICCCLQNPALQKQLPQNPALQKQFPQNLQESSSVDCKRYLKENLEQSVSLVAEAEDTESLEIMMSKDIFDRQNIDAAIEICNRMGKSTLLGVLMNYKNTAFGAEPFDFSL